MRRVAAAVVDVAATALLGLAGFWVAYTLTPCTDVAECPPLAPLAVLGVMVFVGGYYLAGYALTRSTMGQWLCGAESSRDGAE